MDVDGDGSTVAAGRTAENVVPVLLRMRAASPESEAVYDWFVRVYVAKLSALMEAETKSGVKPNKSTIDWPSPAAVAKSYDAPHLNMDGLALLGATLFKIGFRVPTTRAGPVDLRNVVLPFARGPRDRWNYVKMLIEAGTILRNIDGRANVLAHLLHDYVLAVACESPEHFAIAWLVGPYLEQLRRDSEREPTRKDAAVAYKKLVIPDVLGVAMDRRLDTERVARKHWGRKDAPAVVDRAWNAVADLFGRLNFPEFDAPTAVLRYTRAIKGIAPPPSASLMRIAAIAIPESPVTRAALRAAFEEIADHHSLVHFRAKKNIRFDTIRRGAEKTAAALTDPDAVIESIFRSLGVGASTPLEGCFDDDPDEDAYNADEPAVVRVIGVVAPPPEDAAEVADLRGAVESLSQLVSAQRVLLEKAERDHAEDDKRAAEIVGEAARMRVQLADLSAQAENLRKEADKNAAAVLEATRLANEYRALYEDLNSKQARLPPAPAPTGSVPPPPPPPPANGPAQLSKLATDAGASKRKVDRASKELTATRASVDETLVDVEKKAETSATTPMFSPADLLKRANALKKVNRAAVALQKDEPPDAPKNEMMEAIRKAMLVRRRDTSSESDDSDNSSDFDADAAHGALCTRLATLLYSAMLEHVY